MVSPKTKQILLIVVTAGSGLLSIVLLVGFIAAQITMIRFLSPKHSSSSAVPSRISSPQPSQKDTENNPLRNFATQETARSAEYQDTRDPTVDGSDTLAATGRGHAPSPSNLDPRNLAPGTPDSSNQSSVVSQDAQSDGTVRAKRSRYNYTPPAPSWNKPHVPYKRYRKGEQPPWVRPTKQVVELRKNDPDFDLTEELSKIRQEMIESQENAQ